MSTPTVDGGARVQAALPDVRIGRRIGGGAGGVVFAASGPSDEPLAVKVATGPLGLAPFRRERLRREGEILLTCDHENLVAGRRLSETDDLTIFEMDWVEPVTVLEHSYHHGLPWPSACSVLLAVAGALDAIHSLGYLHGDVMPENVLFDQNGQHRLVDLGLARRWPFAVPKRVSGTPQFMAPECIIPGGELLPATDIYALGMTSYELFTGQLPFGPIDDPLERVLSRQVDEQPTAIALLLPQLPQELSGLITAMIDKDVARRPESAAEVRSQLVRAMSKNLDLREVPDP